MFCTNNKHSNTLDHMTDLMNFPGLLNLIVITGMISSYYSATHAHSSIDHTPLPVPSITIISSTHNSTWSGNSVGSASHLLVTLFMISIEESNAGYNVELLHSPDGSQDSTHTPLRDALMHRLHSESLGPIQISHNIPHGLQSVVPVAISPCCVYNCIS